MRFPALLFVSLAGAALAVNFDFEKTQLTEAETRDYPDIAFGTDESFPPKKECRYIPGDDEWPSDAEWEKFNEELGGALLKPLPLAVVCYNGPQYNAARCEELRKTWTSMEMHANHPISIMSQWASGSSCVPTSDPTSSCTQGGYAVYVVNATTVRHIQLAVNFARNRNIRLTIKNSGHDFNGKSIGGNSLGVWVHNLKGYTFHEEYSADNYTGPAVAYAGGFQSQDTRVVQTRHNITILTAGGPTVGIAGGFLQGGGHSTYTSYYGLAADHVLSIQAVVASGELVTADAQQNSDLFWAFRGGGGGTFGIITSVIVRVFPQTPVTTGSITFSTDSGISDETFWDGMRAHWAWSKKINDIGGLGYNFIRHTPNGNTTALTYTTRISLPNKSTSEYRAFVRPHIEELSALGITVVGANVKRHATFDVLTANPFTSPELHPRTPDPSDIHPRALGDTVGNTLIASRLFSLSNWASPSALEEMHLAIRAMVEKKSGGYTFHGMNYSPSLSVAGNPHNAVNPAFRTAVMHAQAYEADAHWDGLAPQRSIAEQKKRHDRLQGYMDGWKAVTVGGGAYMNEGDMQEREWKEAFYGGNYDELVNVKGKWDPWGLFWVVSGVGSDGWEVRGSSGGGRGGVFTQDGRLCRV